MDSFEKYILSNHTNDLIEVLKSQELHNNFVINIDFLKLFEADPLIGDGILCNSQNILPKCDTVLCEIQKKIIDEQNGENDDDVLCLKPNIRARFFGLPACPELHRIFIPKNKDLNCFLKLTGTAIRITQSKMLEFKRSYKCSKCNHNQIVEGEFEHKFIIKAPSECTNPINCRNTNFTPIHNVTRENCKDYQEMKIQEQVNKLAVGGIPGSIWVTLEDDLVDCCKPGDDVSICGTVLRRWQPISANKKCEVELVLRANHVEVCNSQKITAVAIDPNVRSNFEEFWANYERCPLRGRDVILASFCPKVYGLYMVKLALLLTIITGSSHVDIEVNKNASPNTKQSVRGQCHTLLVGDPGTGKSQLLKASAMLTVRSVLTSGSGSTKAGLTCTALREDGEWQLEAGALVLADGGTCCIDELAQMRVHDRASIHEAMEQQTISVAKAGIICKLSTRCAVIAACNPKGNYDTDQPLSVNISLGTPLLSRFDLIFILLDRQTKSWDKLVADYILFGITQDMSELNEWSLEKLQSYVSLVAPFDVVMTPKATAILQAYYVMQRKSENRDPSRTTVRMLDSLVRLTQSHAKLMFRNRVQMVDAITAILLVDLSMQDCTLTGSSDVLQSTFSKYPDFHYLKNAERVLKNLNLCHIWEEELLHYAQVLKIDRRQLIHDLENENMSNFAFYKNKSNEKHDKEIVESSYFKKKEEASDVTDDSDGANHNENKNNDFPEQSEINTKNLLAKSLKKQSAMNATSKMHHVGMISRNKKNKSKNIQNSEKKTKTMKRKANEKKNSCITKKKKVSFEEASTSHSVDVVSETESSSGDDFNEIKILNCLPSVNDAFNALDFTISDDEEKSLQSNEETSLLNHRKDSIDTSHSSIYDIDESEKQDIDNISNSLNNKTSPLVKNDSNQKLIMFKENLSKNEDCQVSYNNLTELIINNTNEIRDDNCNVANTPSKEIQNKNNKSKTSPLSENTMKKLQAFSFHSKPESALVDKTTSNEATNKQLYCVVENNKVVKSNNNEDNNISIENKFTQRSIFETDDNYDVLDI